MTSATDRDERRNRRQQDILEAATDLFYERGFHGTSLDDIGESLGITGPAIYRHFKTKEDLLLAALFRGWDARERGVAIAETLPPREALETLVDSYVSVAIEFRRLIAIYYQEQRYLPENPRHKLRRDQHRFIEAWIRAVRHVRSELDDEEVRSVVHGLLNLINSVSQYSSNLPPERLAHRLREMAWGALMADFDPVVEIPLGTRTSLGSPD